MQKIDVTKVKANGISGRFPWPQSDKVIPVIETALSVFKLRHTQEDIFRKMYELDPHDDLAAGRRYSDNNAVAVRIMSALVEQAFTLTENVEEAHNIIYNFIENISGAEMDIIIIDGLRCSASADHWYMYEKQWD